MMNQEALFKKIGLILNELNSQYEFLAQNPEQLNELELALFQSNTNFLSDHAQILIKISSGKAPLEIQAATDQQALKPNFEQIDDSHEDLKTAYDSDSLQEIQQIEAIAFTEETPTQPDVKLRADEIFKLDPDPSTFEFILNESPKNERFDFEEKSVDELFNRPLSQEEENILAQKRKLRETPIETPIDADEDEIGPEPFLVSKSEAEEFPIDKENLDLEVDIERVINTKHVAVEDPSYKPTLNDLLAEKTNKSVNANNEANRISDLKKGINLNDKLLYIKDLFNGYNLAYAEAIDLANKLPNFESADSFFKKNYAGKNNWAEKQATVDKFYALLNQRFK